MLLAALLFIAIPLRKFQGRLLHTALPMALFIGALSISLYQQIGTPDARSQPTAAMPNIDDMVASLAARLEENPNDLPGWKMLGRSYIEIQDYPKAIQAYEKAAEMESSLNGQTLVDLGEAILMNDNSAMTGRAGQLFESALAIAPDNSKALFYAGMSAAERGDRDTAADRWEALLATGPPGNIEQVIRTRIAEWRGTPLAPVAEQRGSVITANVSIAGPASATIEPGATVFIIARDPAQPRPPIAAVRRQAGELPAAIELSDSDAMIPGRVPSGFAELEIIARVSQSGQPIAQPGDWFGQAIINTSSTSEINIVIDQQVQ
jgi:cytochrome c-type biogenesis protein CcmH